MKNVLKAAGICLAFVCTVILCLAIFIGMMAGFVARSFWTGCELGAESAKELFCSLLRNLEP